MARRTPNRLQGSLFTSDGRRPKRARRKKRRKPAVEVRKREPHTARAAFSPRLPLHVVLRVEREISSLRQRDMYKALRRASVVVMQHSDVRIIHISIQRTHIHLIVEAADRRALARGMRSFQISAAKRINRVMGNGQKRRRGRVFSDRYHADVITNPLQAHRTLNYVLNNWRKHREDFGDERAERWFVDPFSTAILFDGWRERDMIPQWRDYEALVVSAPQTWLLRVGWQHYGPLSCLEIPGRPNTNK